MNVIHNVLQLFAGAGELWHFFQGVWSALPIPCQLLLSFSLGSALLIGLLSMVT